VHAPCARWKKSFWYGTAPSLHIKHDTAYLISTKAVPNYDQTVKVSEATLQGYADSLAKGGFGPMQFGRFTSYMGTTGGRPEIGLMPDSYAATLLSMDKRAKDLMLASADAAGSWMSHRRDDSKGPNQGMPLSVINFPYATVLGNPGDADNPLTGKNEKLPSLTSVSSQGADSSHQAAFAYLPYLLTGDYYYLEELHFWASFNSYLDNCWYRQFEKALVSPDQLRGQGWSLRTLAECAAITPDAHPNKQNYIYWYECNMSYYNTAYIDVPDPRYGNQLGIIANGYSVVYSMNGGASNGTAPWQDDFFTQALGHGVELLGYESAKRLLTWKSKFQIGRLLAPGTCIQNAAIYALGVRKDQASPFFATLAECMDFTLPAEQKAAACNSPERLALASSKCLPGDIDGYPNSTEGYPSNYQPALAAAVDSGYVDGLKAWAMFAARPTKPDYSTGAQFAIVPRLVTEVTPPPAPDPAPAPTPAPEPTPTPTPTPTTVAGTIKGPTNTKLVKLTGLSMTVFAPSTMTVVKRFTNLTASSKGVLIVKDVALAPGTVYAAVVADNTGKVLDVMYPLTAV
jgi:hypothetical protein